MKRLKRVIFLDIDGVLQPPGRQERFKYDLLKLREDLANQYEDDEYRTMDKYDLGAVYYDWDINATERLRNLCNKTGAEIVISSNWRTSKPLPILKKIFRLHNLDSYVVGATPQIYGKYRTDEIAEYLKLNKDIKRFIILDDLDRSLFQAKFPKQFVYCQYVFDEEGYKKALRILNTTTTKRKSTRVRQSRRLKKRSTVNYIPLRKRN